MVLLCCPIIQKCRDKKCNIYSHPYNLKIINIKMIISELESNIRYCTPTRKIHENRTVSHSLFLLSANYIEEYGLKLSLPY